MNAMETTTAAGVTEMEETATLFELAPEEIEVCLRLKAKRHIDGVSGRSSDARRGLNWLGQSASLDRQDGLRPLQRDVLAGRSEHAGGDDAERCRARLERFKRQDGQLAAAGDAAAAGRA